jgi:negative regulator of genetic competence, sporulation and motility
MELLLITTSRLKIVMTSADMQKYDITCENLDYDERGTKNAIRNILDEAKHKVGFDAKGNRVFVQVFPSKDGGCEMYVTKTGMEHKNSLPVPRRGNGKEQSGVFCFASMDLLLAACKQLCKDNSIYESAAYVQQAPEQYYLWLLGAERDVLGRSCFSLSVANEYGKPMQHPLAKAYLKEHCACICTEDAVHILGSLS